MNISLAVCQILNVPLCFLKHLFQMLIYKQKNISKDDH